MIVFGEYQVSEWPNIHSQKDQISGPNICDLGIEIETICGLDNELK